MNLTYDHDFVMPIWFGIWGGFAYSLLFKSYSFWYCVAVNLASSILLVLLVLLGISLWAIKNVMSDKDRTFFNYPTRRIAEDKQS